MPQFIVLIAQIPIAQIITIIFFIKFNCRIGIDTRCQKEPVMIIRKEVLDLGRFDKEIFSKLCLSLGKAAAWADWCYLLNGWYPYGPYPFLRIVCQIRTNSIPITVLSGLHEMRAAPFLMIRFYALWAIIVCPIYGNWLNCSRVCQLVWLKRHGKSAKCNPNRTGPPNGRNILIGSKPKPIVAWGKKAAILAKSNRFNFSDLFRTLPCLFADQNSCYYFNLQ